MAAALEQSFNYREVILDLDRLSNLGHPCWEFLQPLDLVKINNLFKRFNKKFFNNLLEQRSIGLEELGKMAGVTIPPVRTSRRTFSTINLNKDLGQSMLRRELIETLLVCITINRERSESEFSYIILCFSTK